MTDWLRQSAPDDLALETALKELLDIARTQTDDPTGTYTVPAQAPDTAAYTIEITAESPADSQQAPRVSYCLDCEWRVSTAEYPAQEISTQLLDHALETGHDIESTDRPLRSASNNDQS